MKSWLLPTTISLLLLLFLFTTSVHAITGPQAYLTEYVTGYYWHNGSVKTAASRTGEVEASVPNDEDVLQYVQITLTDYNPNTTVVNPTAYKNVITSYTAGGWGANPNNTQIVYSNISGDDQASSYILNDTDAAPTINLSITWSNQKGGTDLYDSDNLYYTSNNITFNLTIRNPSDQKSLSNVNVTIYFSQDTGPGNEDAATVTATPEARDLGGTLRGTSIRRDEDGDGDYERVNWIGTLENSGNQKVIYLKFYANITEATQFPNNQDDHDLDDTYDKGTHANYTSSGATLSGTSISDKFSRGPIRQGIDLSLRGNFWHVRGLIRSMAASSPTNGDAITYNVSYWKVHEISPDTGAPMTPANQSGNFSTNPNMTADDGRIYTTDSSRSSNTTWYNTSVPNSGSKPYFTISMDWQVIWNTEQNDFTTGYINTTMDLPTLYVIDITHTKDASDGYISPDTGDENVTFDDNVTFVGSSEAPAHEVEIYSIIPGKTILGEDHGDFNIFGGRDSLRLYYVNGSGTYQLNISDDQDQTAVTVTVTDPNAGTEGYINISTYDFSSILLYGSDDTIGTDFDTANDRLWLIYVVASSSEMSTGHNYRFNGTNTLETDTGTPLIETHETEYLNVSGRRLIGWKQLIAFDTTNPSVINSSILLEAQDGTGNGIPGIKFIDYIPNWTMNLSQYVGNVTVQFCETGCTTWTEGTEYNITDNGTHTLPDGALVHAFEFINATGDGTWNLTDGQFINVTYQIDVIDSGLYVLPVIISAFDPATGETFDTAAYGIIKVIVPEPSVPLQTTEGDLELAKRVVVGKPVLWVKEFEVYNPNPRAINSRFETIVFNDVMDGYVSYYNEQGEKIELAVGFADSEYGRLMYWDDIINPLETRAYELRVLTPPVLEIDRDIEVLEKLENRMVKLKMDIYLKNFAEEEYDNIILNLPISYQNIFEVRDAFGNQMAFTGGADTSSITIDRLEPDGLKTVIVIYKESYPTIIITPDRDRYDLNAPVNLEILIINGGDKIEYPYIEIEIYTPQMDVMFTTIEKLEEMEPLEKTEMYEKFVIPAYAPGGMYLASARFRENFVTLASATGNFFVTGGVGVSIPESVQILIVVIVILVLGYVSIKRIREGRLSARKSITS